MSHETAVVANIALLIDIENFVSSASTLGLPLDLSPVLARLKEFGSIRVRRSFGDLKRVCDRIHRTSELDTLRVMLHRNLIEIEDIPFITQHKNAADVRLVVEGMTLSFTNPSITHFAILSNDRDFVPLFNKLREMGKTLIAVVVDESSSNPMLREAVDHLLYFESLFDKNDLAGGFDAEGDLRARQESYFKLLRHATTILENKGMRPSGPALASMMRQLRSDFEPGLIGCDSFRGFVQRAASEGAVLLDASAGGGDYVVCLPPAATVPVESPGSTPKATPAAPDAVALASDDQPQPIAAPTAVPANGNGNGNGNGHAHDAANGPDAPAATPGNPAKLAESYREIVELTLGIKLPRDAQRRLIFECLAESYRDLIRVGSFQLREWASEAEYLLSGRTESQTTTRAVYKILLTLFYARCFHVIVEDKFNPKIVGIAIPPEEWEDRFTRHLVTMILRKSRELRMSDAAVSLLLFEESEGEPLARASMLLEEILAAGR